MQRIFVGDKMFDMEHREEAMEEKKKQEAKSWQQVEQADMERQKHIDPNTGNPKKGQFLICIY